MPPGDGVTVPAGLARPLARLAVIGARKLQEDSGGLVLVPGIAAVLAELDSIAGDGAPRTVVLAGSSWLSAREASGASGYSAARLRELARGGRIICRKFGDRWQYDADSIARYRKDRVA